MRNLVNYVCKRCKANFRPNKESKSIVYCQDCSQTRKKKWSKKYFVDFCLSCGSKEKKPSYNGLCETCYLKTPEQIQRKRIYYRNNRIKLIKKAIQWNKEHKMKANKHAREWYKKNKEKRKQKAREYYHKNKEKYSGYWEKRKLKNKEKTNERGRSL